VALLRKETCNLQLILCIGTSLPCSGIFECGVGLSQMCHDSSIRVPQIIAIPHCNILQHTATQCSTLQHAATHCNTLQHTPTHSNTLQYTAPRRNTLQHTVTYCNTLQHTATHYNTLQHTATHCHTLQYTATHCNTLQHTATHCTCCRSMMRVACLIDVFSMSHSHIGILCDTL